MLQKAKIVLKKPLIRLWTFYQKRKSARFFKIKSERFYRNCFANHPVPELSEKDKSEIARYWEPYGIHIKNFDGFKWYYGTTGIHDPRFLPNDIYCDILVPYLNDTRYVEAYRDKSVFSRILPDLPFPETILKNIRGRLYDSENRFVSEETAKRILKEPSSFAQDIIIKENSGGCGKQVQKIKLASDDDVEKVLTHFKYSQGCLVQKVIQQHPFFAQFNEDSVNILRINTLFINGRVIILDNIALRYGQSGSHTDVSFVNGNEIVNVIGITKSGRLMEEVLNPYCHRKKCSELFQLSLTQVPAFEEIRQTVIKGAEQLPYFNLIGWDVTVDINEKPVVIEYNIVRPGSMIYQYFGPFFGDHTEEALAFLKNDENRKKYLPDFYSKS